MVAREAAMTTRRSLALVTLVVREYDEAIAYFTQALRFALVEDRPLTAAKRWVVLAPSTAEGCRLLLAKASTPRQSSHIGEQTGGRVALFLHTSDFAGDYEHMRAHGVAFIEEPREEAYGRVAVFRDLYGNKWDLVQPR